MSNNLSKGSKEILKYIRISALKLKEMVFFPSQQLKYKQQQERIHFRYNLHERGASRKQFTALFL